MKITLNNFRVFSGITVIDDVPIFNSSSSSSSFTLLTGESGVGKSSILMAIDFALTGIGSGKQLTTYGKKSMSVKIENFTKKHRDDLVVERSRGPSRLVVKRRYKNVNERTDDDFLEKIYEDKEAESLLTEYVRLWQYAYVPQKYYKSFVFMQPREKLEYVETIAFDHVNANVMLEKCETLRRERSSRVKASEQCISSFCCFREEGEGEKYYDSMEDAVADETKYRNAMLKAKERLDGCKSLHDLRLKIQDEITRMEETVEFDETTMMNGIDLRQEEDEWLNVRDKWIKYSSLCKKLKELEVGISTLSESTYGRILPCIKESDSEERKEFNFLCRKLKDENVINVTSIVAFLSDCPNCRVDLAYDFDSEKVVVVESSIKKKKLSVRECCVDIDRKLRLNRLKRKYDEYIDDYETELKRQDVYDRISDLKRRKIDIQIQIDELGRCEEPIELRKKILEARRKWNVYVERKNRLDSLPQTNELDELKEEYERCRNEYEECRMRKKQYEAYVENEKLSIMKRECEELRNSVVRTNRIYTIIRTAMNKCMETTLNLIDRKSSIYIDSFLPKYQLSLNVNDRKLDVDCFVDGNEANVTCLSGGETARIIVAYALSMVEITMMSSSSSKFIVLDEILSPLDEEMTNRVLSTIRKSFKGNILCVSHQATRGLFDKIIDVNNLIE